VERTSASIALAVVLCASGSSTPVTAAPNARGDASHAALAKVAAAPASAKAAVDAKMRVHFINVGQGAATLFEFPNGAVLVDTGGEFNGMFDSNAELDAYLSTFFARRQDLGRRLTSLVLTHPHLDHTRGVANVLAHYPPKNVVTNGKTVGDGGALQVLAQNYAADHEGGPDPVGFVAVRVEQIPPTGLTNAVIDPVGGSPVDPKLTVLWGGIATNPGWGDTTFQNPNNHSVVLRVDFDQASVLITGDLEKKAIAAMLAKYAGSNLLDVDVYEPGHHGALNGTTQDLVTAMSPDYAVFEVGPKDRTGGATAFGYGHPRTDVIELLEAGVSKTRSPLTVWAATGTTNFELTPITKAIYATGWDGTVILEAGADGVFQVASPGGPAATLLDLNTATVAQLEALPRIGPTKAQAIVDYRTAHGAFATVDDLDHVPGIGPATVEAVRALVTIGPP